MENIYDVHCHILPQVDDGADTIQDSLEMLKKEYEDGIRTVILTPHFRKHMFETGEEKIQQQYELLCREAKKALPDLKLYLGCELHANMDMVDLLKQRKQFRMAGSSYVLVEFRESAEKSYIRERLYQLRSNGYDPIIAHAERYTCVAEDMDFVEELVEMGVKIQVNADSIIGKGAWRDKRFCKSLMKHDLLHFVGSDAHDMRERPSRMGECAAYVEKKMGSDYARRIFTKNPSEILM